MSLRDADLMTHLLQMCPLKLQRQYELMENSTLEKGPPVDPGEHGEQFKQNDKPPRKNKTKVTDFK